jgi:hypothetical protein
MIENTVNFYKSKPQEIKFDRQCGDCNMCCKWLYHIVDNKELKPGTPCFYLDGNCTVHEKRPQACRDYFCAYIQGLLPEWMKPNKCNILVNVERWGPNKEYNMLKVLECGSPMTIEIFNWLIQFTREHNNGLAYQVNGTFYFLGPDEFIKEMTQNKPVIKNNEFIL